MLLENHNVVITGNFSGIGRAAAALFAREGAQLFCVDDTADGWEHPDSIQGNIPHLIADVADERGVAAAVSACKSRFDRVDLLLNLAGRTSKHSFEDTTPEVWQRMIGRNLTAAFLCSQGFLPLLKRSASGVIINHASIDATLGNPSLAAYSAAKGGLIPLTHVMAHDLAKYGIRVNSISTGAIRDGAPRPSDHRRTEVTPSGRTGTPEDVARVALFLGCDWSSYVNGANIVVDGGRTGITQGCYED